MTTEDRIRAFIVDELGFQGSSDELTSDFPLLDAEVIDSMGIYSIVTFVEDEYGVAILDEELVPENFSTVTDIARLIDAKRAAR